MGLIYATLGEHELAVRRFLPSLLHCNIRCCPEEIVQCLRIACGLVQIKFDLVLYTRWYAL
jgi:hypothetical protein